MLTSLRKVMPVIATGGGRVLSKISRPSILFEGCRAMSSFRILRLDNLSPNKGAFKKRKRVGRGIGSGRGKNSTKGPQRNSKPRGFEGGQTPLYKTMPKIGFHNFAQRKFQTVSLTKIQEFIDMGRLKVKENEMITMRDLYMAGIATGIDDGIKLLAGNLNKDPLVPSKQTFNTPLHLEVSMASASAIEMVEAAGGTVTCVHFNALALRALMKPYKFELLPRRARPSPKIMNYYLDVSKAGYLAPEIQIRNLKLFGYTTSEEKLIEAHNNYMKAKRKLGLITYGK